MNGNQLSDYLDLDTLIAQYPQFSKSQMRWLVVKKAQNGLASAIKKVGRRLYFHIPSFLRWLELQSA